MTSIVNIADVNVQERESWMATPMLKINDGDQKVCKKKNISWLFGVDRKIRPSGSLSGITQQSLVMPNSDPRIDFLFALHSHERFLYYKRTRSTLWNKMGRVEFRKSAHPSQKTVFVMLQLTNLGGDCLPVDIFIDFLWCSCLPEAYKSLGILDITIYMCYTIIVPRKPVFGVCDYIRLTSPCIEDPLAPHFYIVNLGFTRVYIRLLFHTNRFILSTMLSSMWIIF